MQNAWLFEEFSPVSKADWLAQIARDLKGQSLEELDLITRNGLRITPLVHADDQPTPPTPLRMDAPGWEISEEIRVEDFGKANREALDALEGGAEGLRFVIDTTPDVAQLDTLLQGIHLDYIGLHFRGEQLSPAALLGLLQQIAGKRHLTGKQLRGSIYFNPFDSRQPDWRYIAELVEFAATAFPHFQVICLHLPAFDQDESGLSRLLSQANACLKALSERGISTETAQKAIFIASATGSHFLQEIAKTRAIQLLWLNLLQSWKGAKTYPVIEATVATEAYSDELFANMVRSTNMAMSAVLGGANRLFIPPYDSGRESAATYAPAFGRRIARNVQHLLKMESHLDEISDPAAGSYYLENLTKILAEQAWKTFTETTA